MSSGIRLSLHTTVPVVLPVSQGAGALVMAAIDTLEFAGRRSLATGDHF